jgi:hypothetical protein
MDQDWIKRRRGPHLASGPAVAHMWYIASIVSMASNSDPARVKSQCLETGVQWRKCGQRIPSSTGPGKQSPRWSSLCSKEQSLAQQLRAANSVLAGHRAGMWEPGEDHRLVAKLLSWATPRPRGRSRRTRARRNTCTGTKQASTVAAQQKVCVCVWFTEWRKRSLNTIF